MRKLLYIENDFHPEHLHGIKKKLLNATILPKNRIDAIEPLLAFGNHTVESQEHIIFSPNHIILSHTQYGGKSDAQLRMLMNLAAVKKIKGMIYIDCTGDLYYHLNRQVEYNIIPATWVMTVLYHNYILTLGDMSTFRLSFATVPEKADQWIQQKTFNEVDILLE